MRFETIFPGRTLVRPTEVGRALGWTPGYTRNLVYRKQFPFPLIDINGRKYCRVSDLDDYINRQIIQTQIIQNAAANSTPAAKGRGRRKTKLDRLVEQAQIEGAQK